MKNNDSDYVRHLEAALKAAELEIKGLECEARERDKLLAEIQERDTATTPNVPKKGVTKMGPDVENERTTKPDSAMRARHYGLGLDAEVVQCYLYALLDEVKRRGGMFPQTSDEQDSDSDAIYRICEMVKWYGEQGYPRTEAVANLRAMRAQNATPNTCIVLLGCPT